MLETNKIMKTLSAFLLVLSLSLFSAQKSEAQNNDIIPPMPLSPEAALLHQFVDVPVGHFTGTASISVPIYSIELSTISIPISVDYHSAGHKVDQLATSVGWGWSLNAGGMISFNQIGLNDFETGGYVTGVFDLSNLSYTDKVMMTGTGVNQPVPSLDTQPDIFYFSFPGKSGKFIYDTEGVPYTIPFLPLRIIRNPVNGGFQIWDEIGNLFTFNLREASNWSNNQNPDEIYDSSADYYLTQVSTPNGEVVDFEYRHETQQTFFIIQTERRTLDSNPCETPTYDYSESNYIINNIGTYQLDRITSNYGHVIDFVYSPSVREDCNSTSCAALNRIKINYQSDPVPVKEFIISTSYYIAANPGSYGYKNKRLKLDSITELGKGCYAFDYYNINSTAALHSYSQDLYGYNNGVFNN